MFILSLSMHDALVWITFVLCFVVLALTSWLIRVLRSRHEAVWMALGAPTGVYGLSPGTQWKVNRFLWKSDYKQLADPVVGRLAISVKIVTLAIVVSVMLAGVFWTGREGQ